MRYNFKYYCKDYENIENYEKALADNFVGWEVHHRLETHTPDGKRREVDIGYKELIALGMYYNRPAEELIFLTRREHNAIRKVSAETRNKIHEAKKGNKYHLGKRHSEEAKKKMREAHKGKHLTDETRNKMHEAKKGEKNPMYGKKHSEETKKKISEARKGKPGNVRGTHWYHNGEINIRAKECPPGFVPGQLR